MLSIDLLHVGAQERRAQVGRKGQPWEQWHFGSVCGWSVRDYFRNSNKLPSTREKWVRSVSKVIALDVVNNFCYDYRQIFFYWLSWTYVTVFNISCWPLIFLQCLRKTRQHECHGSLSFWCLLRWSLLALSTDGQDEVHRSGPTALNTAVFKLQDCGNVLVNQIHLGLPSVRSPESRKWSVCVAPSCHPHSRMAACSLTCRAAHQP